ncbi:MAG: 30S ribosomal protein S8 [Patescibacteria group bacterium]|nr:30S ribosomal protein S8 [Patescibacteria group bacterium]
MQSDSIADMISTIKNGIRCNFKSVETPKANLKLAILKVLKQNGYILGYDVEKGKLQEKIKINLKYVNSQPSINEFKKISTPGRRFYRGYSKIPKSLNGMGSYILSTTQGVMSDREARAKHLGGEIICEIN